MPKENKKPSSLSDDEVAVIRWQDETDFQKLVSGSGEKTGFRLDNIRRLMINDLAYDGVYTARKLCGFTSKDIEYLMEYPARNSAKLIRLSRYVYRKSGHYRRLLQYFAQMPTFAGYLSEALDMERVRSGKVSREQLLSKYGKLVQYVEGMNVPANFLSVTETLFLEDVFYGVVLEQGGTVQFQKLNPLHCRLEGKWDDGTYAYSYDLGKINAMKLESYPVEIQELYRTWYEEGKANKKLTPWRLVPQEISACFKLDGSCPYPYPMLFSVLADILDLDNYKELAKAKAEIDSYRFIVQEIPVDSNETDALLLSEPFISAFSEGIDAVTPRNIGVLVSPMKTSAISFNSSTDENTKAVDAATKDLYSAGGVAPALFAGATQASTLVYSMEADAALVYAALRQYEWWMNCWLRRKGKASAYGCQWTFHLLNQTIYNTDKVVERLSTAATNSLPVKRMYAASLGLSSSDVLYGGFFENDILQLQDSWTSLQTSWTKTGDDGPGRDAKADSEITEVTEAGRDNDSNNADNRTT